MSSWPEFFNYTTSNYTHYCIGYALTHRAEGHIGQSFHQMYANGQQLWMTSLTQARPCTFHCVTNYKININHWTTYISCLIQLPAGQNVGYHTVITVAQKGDPSKNIRARHEQATMMEQNRNPHFFAPLLRVRVGCDNCEHNSLNLRLEWKCTLPQRIMRRRMNFHLYFFSRLTNSTWIIESAF